MDLRAARRAWCTLACLLLPFSTSAQEAFQVVDLNTSVETNAFWTLPPQNMGSPGSTVYFSANDGVLGLELWKSDGTAAGTVLVRDLCPGSCSSHPGLLRASAGRLFFTADDGAHGRELWVTDGTAAGTRLVRDIRPGLASGIVAGQDMIDLGGTVFFAADDGVHGEELWSSDGSTAGTVLVEDVRPGPVGSEPAVRTASGTLLFFNADDGTHGREPWVSDGTAAGTSLVEDIRPGAEGSVFPFTFSSYAQEWVTTSSGLFVFLAHDGTHGTEPWVSDGTEAGTSLLADLLSGPNGSFPQSFVEMAGTVYFAADGPTGFELWKTGGVPGDPAVVKEIRPDGNSGPFELTVVGGLLFFRANDGVHGVELWKSDGTPAGTQLVKDIVPGAEDAFFPGNRYGFSALGNTLMFGAFDGTGFEIWKSDGTPAGTVPLTSLSPDVAPGFVGGDWGFHVAGGRYYYRAFELPGSMDLWSSDGTAAGTGRVKDLCTTTDSLLFANGDETTGPSSLLPFGGELLFQATDGSGDWELWKTNGTAAGTLQLSYDSQSPSLPHNLIRLGSAAFFTSAETLWQTDGTPAGTTAVTGASTHDSGLARYGDRIYFARSEYDLGEGGELWRTDGTEAGTERVADINPGPDSSGPHLLTVAGGQLFFVASTETNLQGLADWELWQTDGTEAGTVQVRDIRPGVDGSFPHGLTNVAGTLLFFAEDAATGRELWRSDGTEAGTVRVKDIRPGAAPSVGEWLGPYAPPLHAVVGATFYFVADDGTSGPELWKSDGTAAGTVLVKDLFPGARGSEPLRLTRVRNRLFFVADDGIHGRELWVSDGTAAGTVMVADLVPGAETSLPQHLAASGPVLLFSAWDAVHGRELWKSDGTAAGTVRLDDIAPGAASASPFLITPGFPNVYFGANDSATGFELWAFPRAALGGTFADVPPAFWAFPWVEALADAGLTTGCGGGNYCPGLSVTRAEVAVFLLRASRGGHFTPPPATGTRFGDVPASYWAAAWIEQLAADGITLGCGGGNFCPERSITRAELAVQLQRARVGSAFLPPPGNGTVFTDVPPGYWALDWIEHLAALKITLGCGGGNYCPELPVTRAEMAPFLVRTFELPGL